MYMCYLVNMSGKNTTTFRWLRVSETFFQSQIKDPLTKKYNTSINILFVLMCQRNDSDG